MRQKTAIDDFEAALYKLSSNLENNLRAIHDALVSTLPPGYPKD